MVNVVVEIKTKEVAKKLAQAAKTMGDTQGLMENLGESLLNTTLERMDREESPDGEAWQRLNSGYAAGKKSNKMLQEQGMSSGLKGSLHYNASQNELVLGTDKIYARVHQFGADIEPVSADNLHFKIGNRFVKAKKVTIPARPYIGIGHNEEIAILNVAEDLMRRAFA